MARLNERILIPLFKLTEGYLFNISVNNRPRPICSKCECKLRIGQQVILYEYNNKKLLLKHDRCSK